MLKFLLLICLINLRFKEKYNKKGNGKYKKRIKWNF